MEKKMVVVMGMQVWYRGRGEGVPILILPGWGGPADDYFQLQDKLAEIGYQVVLPDLPGICGKTAPRYIALEEWGSWVDQFVKATIGVRKSFILISHSGSGRVALEYLATGERCLCSGSIFWSPGLISQWQRWFLRIVEKPLRFLIPSIFPNMKWMRNRETWATAYALFLSSSPEETQPKIPWMVLLGKKDPITFFFTGWKKLNCQKITHNWDHSPHLRAIEELVLEIHSFVERELKGIGFLT